MEKVRKQLVKTPHGTVEYTQYGEGIPVLFLHGGHSNCLDRLSHLGFHPKKYWIITPSRPGYGKTVLKNNESPEAAAKLMAAFLDKLGIKKTIVYGISAAGPLAITFAAVYKERILKLILASAVSGVWLRKNGKNYILANVIFNPQVEWLTWGLVRRIANHAPTYLTKSFFRQFSLVKGHKISKEESRRLSGTMKHYSSGSGFLNDLKQATEAKKVGKISCPTLILHSKFDNSVHLSHAHYLKRLIPHSDLQLLENPWGHMIWIDDSRHGVESKIQHFLS